MCAVSEQIAKLCQMGGQIEHDLAQLLAFGKAYKTGNPNFDAELQRALAILIVRTDQWAIEYFHRMVERVAAAPEGRQVFPQLTEEQSPGDSVNEAMAKARDLLS